VPLKIGYFPLSDDLSAPGDRRRVVHWAKKRGHILKLNEVESVDIIIVSEVHTSAVKRRSKGIPVVLDLVDAYYLPDGVIVDYARMVLRFVQNRQIGRVQRFSSFTNSLVSEVDLVITSSPEQRSQVEYLNSNTLDILDFHEEFPMLSPVKNFQDLRNFQVMWEGTTHTLGALKGLNFSDFAGRQLSFVAAIVVDPTTNLLPFNCLPVKTGWWNRGLLNNYCDKWHLIPWSIDSVIDTAKHSHFSLLPIRLHDPFQSLKPENRLLISWRLGLPAFVSRSRSHARIESTIGLPLTFLDVKGFSGVLANYLEYRSLFQEQVEVGQDYLRTFHSEEVLLRKWDSAIYSLV